jgi:hypothetical protein
MENEELEILEETLDILDDRIREAEDGKEAREYAEAYKLKLEADSLEWREAQKLCVEKQKNKLVFWGTVIAGAIGAAITSGIKVIGDLKYQEIAQKFEDEGAFVNYQKHKRR